ncbi:MAG: HAD family hydrolase [Candidatus Bathyarchaeia archaeon]
MAVRAVLFDLYGTLIDIETDERDWYTYLALAKYLGYRGISLSADEVRWFYFEKIRQMIEGSHERYPEIDVRRIWRELLGEHENPRLYRLNLDQCTFLEDIVALHRSLTLRRLRLFDATLDTVQSLKQTYLLGVVSDCQREYAVPEMRMLGIDGLFDALIVSAEYGFRKPDRRLFNGCLSKLNVSSREAVFVGNNPYRDIGGAKSVGMRNILVLGRRKREEVREAEPDFIVDDIGKVPEIVQRL